MNSLLKFFPVLFLILSCATLSYAATVQWESISDKVSVLIEKKEFLKAEEMAKAAMKIAREDYPEGHPASIFSLQNLGFVYFVKGEYEKTKACYEQALELSLKSTLANDYVKARSHYLLGDELKRENNLKGAKHLYMSGLPYQVSAQGSSDPEVGGVYEKLGNMSMDLGEYGEAIDFYRKQVRVAEYHVGSTHFATAGAYNNLGFALSKQKKYPEAEQYFQKALLITEREVGKDSLAAAGILDNIADLKEGLGQNDKANRLRIRSDEIKNKNN